MGTSFSLYLSHTHEGTLAGTNTLTTMCMLYEFINVGYYSVCLATHAEIMISVGCCGLDFVQAFRLPVLLVLCYSH